MVVLMLFVGETDWVSNGLNVNPADYCLPGRTLRLKPVIDLSGLRNGSQGDTPYIN